MYSAHCTSIMKDEQIKLLKHQHGNTLHMVEVDNGTDEPHVFVFKPVDRKTLSAASVVGANDNTKFAEVIIKNSMVYGDAALLEDVSIFLAVSGQVETLMQVRKASIKNL